MVRGIARNVVPRVARVESADTTQISLTTVPATQTALIEAGREMFPEHGVVSVPSHVVDALEEDL